VTDNSNFWRASNALRAQTERNIPHPFGPVREWPIGTPIASTPSVIGIIPGPSRTVLPQGYFAYGRSSEPEVCALDQYSPVERPRIPSPPLQGPHWTQARPQGLLEISKQFPLWVETREAFFGQVWPFARLRRVLGR